MQPWTVRSSVQITTTNFRVPDHETAKTVIRYFSLLNEYMIEKTSFILPLSYTKIMKIKTIIRIVKIFFAFQTIQCYIFQNNKRRSRSLFKFNL